MRKVGKLIGEFIDENSKIIKPSTRIQSTTVF
jgi:hypothetical protein